MSDVEENISDPDIVVKKGVLVRVVEFKIIKLITYFFAVFLIIDIIFSLKLFVSAIQIRSHLGYFINMISSGDGDILPTLQAIPVLLFLITNCIMGFFVFAIFDASTKPGMNRSTFFSILVNLLLLVILFIIIISVIAHAYGTHEKLHDGIVTAMRHYHNNSVLKSQMDHLQIEFQCCGSKKYDEWYSIKWTDPSLEQGIGTASDGNTPFSCCSMKSLSPCIHHYIEVTGKAYLYTPEFNLSISTRGCYEMIRKKKQEIAWIIVGNLFLYFLLQTITTALVRFLQTAHFAKYRFYGNTILYTVWLFGSYSGKVKKDPTKTPPKPPPVPPELRN